MAKHSPLLYSYLKKYQQDPHSRVFAPLSEAYRKAGMLDEAIEIAKEGLRIHPTFMGGRVTFARALFDKERYKEVVQELTHVIEEVPDNLVAQRLYADSCLILGKSIDALNAYKMLLYFKPGDLETSKVVSELERQILEDDPRQLVKESESDLAAPIREEVPTVPEEDELSDIGQFHVSSPHIVSPESIPFVQKQEPLAPPIRSSKSSGTPDSERQTLAGGDDPREKRLEFLQKALVSVERYRKRAALRNLAGH